MALATGPPSRAFHDLARLGERAGLLDAPDAVTADGPGQDFPVGAVAIATGTALRLRDPHHELIAGPDGAPAEAVDDAQRSRALRRLADHLAAMAAAGLDARAAGEVVDRELGQLEASGDTVEAEARRAPGQRRAASE